MPVRSFPYPPIRPDREHEPKRLAAQMGVEMYGTGRAYRTALAGHGNLQGNRGTPFPAAPGPRGNRPRAAPPGIADLADNRVPPPDEAARGQLLRLNGSAPW